MSPRRIFFVLTLAFTATVVGATDPLANLTPQHPRLLWPAADTARVKKAIDADPVSRAFFERLREQSDGLLDKPLLERKLKGRRLLGVSREALARITELSFLYRITGKPAYFDRARAELLNVAAFQDWNPSHFLDVAEMTAAVATGYDWLFDRLSPEDRKTLRQAIIEKGINTSFKEGSAVTTQATNNWNSVCNGGMTMGALAIAEDEPNLARRVIERTLAHVPQALNEYEPDGVYPEGPNYWTYGTSYNVILIAALQSALGSDLGLADFPGFRATPLYIRWAYGPSGHPFNYSDNPDGQRGFLPPMFWFAKTLGDPSIAATDEALLAALPSGDASEQKPGEGDRFGVFALIWRTSLVPAGRENALPLGWIGRGHTPVAFHRSSWKGPDALYLAIKAGSPSTSHAHMDCGSFVLDADGERWASDPSRRDYNELESAGVKYWGMEQDSDRWKVFESGPFSHNLVMIDGKLPQFSARTDIIRFSSDGPMPHTVLDMSSSLGGQANKAIRGFALLPGRRVLVQDDSEGLRKGDAVRWSLYTSAEVEIVGDRATLSQNGKTMRLEFLTPTGVKLTVDPLTLSNPPWQVPMKGFRQVIATFEATGADLTRIAAVFTPGSTKDDFTPKANDLRPPESWSAKP